MKKGETIATLQQSASGIEGVRYENGVSAPFDAQLAEEMAVALSYSGTTHAVMMATPAHLEDFAVGFSLTEGLITDIAEIEEMTALELENGVDVQMVLKDAKRAAFQQRRRHMAGPVGCGLCGIESIEAAMRVVPHFAGQFAMASQDVLNAVAELSQNQPLNRMTRCAHAAGFYVPGRGLVVTREDIGRHNALDKLIGALLRRGEDIGQGAVVVTSRLSVEMVQKSAMAGAPMVIAISSPSAEAVRIGKQANVTLIARARGSDFEIYCHPDKIRAHPEKSVAVFGKNVRKTK